MWPILDGHLIFTIFCAALNLDEIKTAQSVSSAGHQGLIRFERELMGIAAVKSTGGGGRWDKLSIKRTWSGMGGWAKSRRYERGPDVQLGYKMHGAFAVTEQQRKQM